MKKITKILVFCEISQATLIGKRIQQGTVWAECFTAYYYHD